MQDKDHEALQKEAVDYLERRDFLVAKQGYHESMPKEITKLLGRRFSLTSQYERGGADLFAIHSKCYMEFECEIKTVPGDSPLINKNFPIEVWPLLHHIQHAAMGVRCLYVCRHCRLDYSFGFWADKIPPAFRILFPLRQEYDPVREFMKKKIADVFPKIKIEEPQPSRKLGVSNDPYILIRKNVAMDFLGWETLIENELRKGQVKDAARRRYESKQGPAESAGRLP